MWLLRQAQTAKPFSALQRPPDDLLRMETISAASLVNAMLEAHPEHAGALGRFAEALASGSMGMQAFAAAVRQELGKEVLLEALVRLRGGKKPTVQMPKKAQTAS